MAYTKQTWEDLPSTNTPLTATRLNHIEDGIKLVETESADNDTEIINNIGGKILWTNADPTVTMTTRNITLSSDDYDVLEIIYKAAYNQSTTKNIKMLKNYNTIMTSYSINFTSTSYYMRAISYVDATTLTIGSGYNLNPSNKTQNDGVCIPLYIIGYKTGLFI